MESFSKLDGRTQLEHPGLATPVNCAQSNSTAHLTQRAESTIEKLNIIGEGMLINTSVLNII